MRKTLLMIACVLSLSGGAVHAEVLSMPATTPAASTTRLPAKGETMPVVVKQYGEPAVKHKPAGGGSRRQPPITRWDYDGFSVFFEHGTVIDAVVKGRPAPIHRTEELKPAQ